MQLIVIIIISECTSDASVPWRERIEVMTSLQRCMCQHSSGNTSRCRAGVFCRETGLFEVCGDTGYKTNIGGRVSKPHVNERDVCRDALSKHNTRTQQDVVGALNCSEMQLIEISILRELEFKILV